MFNTIIIYESYIHLIISLKLIDAFISDKLKAKFAFSARMG